MPYETLKEFHEIKKENESIDIVHKKGEILIIDFWANWCGPCINAMNHNQEILLKKAALWGQNVRIVAVSLEKESEE